MKAKFNIRREVKIVTGIALLSGLIAFSERQQTRVVVRDIQVTLENIHENHFIDEGDVMALMDLDKENVRGASIRDVSLRDIEKRIMSDRFVKDADLYSDLKGNVMARVELHRPLARMVRNDGPDGYLAEDGSVMPVSDKYTSRVVLVSGLYVRQLQQMKNANETEEGKQLMELLSMIEQDDFWRAQIAQLDVDKDARITIYPQVGGQTIEFGKPENLEVKLRKLKIFYKRILPQMGWNKYQRVSLEYDGQIVAE